MLCAKRVSMMMFLFCLSTVLVSAQTTRSGVSAPGSDDPARLLLQRVGETYKGLKSYQFEGSYRNENRSESMGTWDENKRIEFFVLAANKPDQSRLESRNPFFSFTNVSDGKTKWEYSPASNEYVVSADVSVKTNQVRAPIDMIMLNARARTVIESYSKLPMGMAFPKIVGEEFVTISGQKIACTVVEAGDPNFTSSAKSQSYRKLWIDSARFLVLREQHRMRNQVRVGATMESNISVEYSVAKINEAVAPSLFTFTPPAGAKLVDELNTPFRAPKRANWAGKDALAFTLKDLEGNALEFASLKGKVVLLDFWASWCGPCVAELPHIEQLHKDFKDKGLVVLGINDEELEIAKSYVKEKGYTFKTLIDEGRAVARLYEVNGIPQVLLIGRDGKIKLHEIGYGEGREKDLRVAVEKVLNGEELPLPKVMGGLAAPVIVSPSAAGSPKPNNQN